MNRGYKEMWINRKQKSMYEHRFIAQKLLKRELKRGEVVHHIDFNRKNNSIDNLLVFRSNADHTRFHNLLNTPDKMLLIYNSDGSLSCVVKKNRCANCGEYISKDGKYCIKCIAKKRRKVERPDMKILIAEIKELSYEGVGRKYGVSGNAIRKWLRCCGIEPKSIKYKKKYK